MDKIKYFLQNDEGKDILVVIILILVGLSSFGLGRLSSRDQSLGVKIEYPAKEAGEVQESTPKNTLNAKNRPKEVIVREILKTFFASTRGNKYYSLGCSGGKTIKQENRIYFTTKEEAEGAGYELSSTCR
ncbi:MAG: hypothetical protein Q8O46_00240 [bacterium]|nr:hypothetical protein [bacterium]